MQSAVRIASSTRACSTKPGAVDDLAEPSRSISASTRGRSGPSPKISARSSGTRSRARASAGTSAGTRFSGMWRPANTTTGRASAGSGASSAPA